MASAYIRSSAIDAEMTAARGRRLPASGGCSGDSRAGSRREAERAEVCGAISAETSEDPAQATLLSLWSKVRPGSPGKKPASVEFYPIC